jgi:hypothetical protein
MVDKAIHRAEQQLQQAIKEYAEGNIPASAVNELFVLRENLKKMIPPLKKAAKKKTARKKTNERKSSV